MKQLEMAADLLVISSAATNGILGIYSNSHVGTSVVCLALSMVALGLVFARMLVQLHGNTRQ